MDYLRSDSADGGMAYEMDPSVAAEVEAELAAMDGAAGAETTAGGDPTAPKRSQSDGQSLGQSTATAAAVAAAAVAAVLTEPGRAESEPGGEPDGGGSAAAKGSGGSPSAASAPPRENFWKFM